MLSRNDLGERFALQYQEAENRRVICGKNIVLHCHHYNSRLQHAMESAANVDGKSIFRSAAAYVFADHIAREAIAHVAVLGMDPASNPSVPLPRVISRVR